MNIQELNEDISFLFVNRKICDSETEKERKEKEGERKRKLRKMKISSSVTFEEEKKNVDDSN